MKLGGTFAVDKNSTLYMFGKQMDLNSAQKSATDEKESKNAAQKPKWKEEKLIINWMILLKLL